MVQASAVEIRNLDKFYGPFQALKQIDLTIPPGKVTCLIGPSGSGKSTLLRCINFLEEYDAGEVRIDGQLIGYEGPGRKMSARKLRQMRRSIGMVFQQFNLWPHMTALENVAEGLIRVRGLGKADAATRAAEALRKVGLEDKMQNHPARLSGGQQQRVAIARAIAMEPRLMLFDEPTSALDPELVGEVLQVMKTLAGEGMTMAVVTHEMGFAAHVADQVAFMEAGELVAVNSPDAILHNPSDPRISDFLRTYHERNAFQGRRGQPAFVCRTKALVWRGTGCSGNEIGHDDSTPLPTAQGAGLKAEPTSLWSISAGERIPAAPLDRDVTVDLAIVGAGFTGCSAALEAARRGASVAVFEASRVAFGGSGRNVGLVNAGLWLPPDQIISQMGEADGTRLIDRLGQAPRLVFDLIERESIACEATRSGTLHLAHSASGLADLRDRFAQGNRIGAPLRLLDAQDTARRVGSGAFHGALLDPRAGTVQPLAYCAGLARAAQGAGARLHEGSAVSDIARQGDGWHLTVNGRTVRARAVLVATNAYQSGLARPRTSFSTVNYSQFATAPLPDDLRARILPGGEGCWDTGLVMTSIRTDRAGRLILGGMGDVAGPGGRAHAAWARRKLRVLFPELDGIAFEYQWSGRIAMTSDHVPKVLRFGPRGLAIFGYSGRGIAPGTAFGTAAAAALLDDRPEAMPLPVVSGHTERFTTLRGAVFEAGATLIHALPPSRFQGRS